MPIRQIAAKRLPLAAKAGPSPSAGRTGTPSSTGPAVAAAGPSMVAYCPTMDLMAVGLVDDSVAVFRLNGQTVLRAQYGKDADEDEDEDEGDLNGDGGGSGYGVVGGGGGGFQRPRRRTKGDVHALRWKADGSLLAVVCADNAVRILSAHSGKTAHVLPPAMPAAGATTGSSMCTCLAWTTNLTDMATTARNGRQGGDGVPSDAVSASARALAGALGVGTARGGDVGMEPGLADLPRELAMLDIERTLPKLSLLPSTGDENDVFSTRASVDSIFHAPRPSADDAVDVLLAAFDDGTVHLRILDCFDIGTFNIRASVSGAQARPLVHASHPLSSTHALLCQTTTTAQMSGRLQLVTIDLRFITRSGRYLSLLAAKTSRLQNLLRYIKQTQTQLQLEYKNTIELPRRFMRSIGADLRERCDCDFQTAVYHLAATGDCWEPLREFLVDIVGERGHKRWEKTVTTAYEAVRRLVLDSLLPALERASVLLSRLIGLAGFHKLSPVLGLVPAPLATCRDTVDCLMLCAHATAVAATEELGQFAAFSGWLRYHIDLFTAEPLSQTAQDIIDRADLLDVRRTLSYVRGPLVRSSLHCHLRPEEGSHDDRDDEGLELGKWAPAGRDGSFSKRYKRLLRRQNEGGSLVQEEAEPASADKKKSELPALGDLTARLNTQCQHVFEQIAETQRRGILHRSPLCLDKDCDPDVTDMTFGPPAGGLVAVNCTAIYITSRSREAPWLLYLYRVVIETINGVSSMKEVSMAKISFQMDKILQARFVEDSTLMILWTDSKNAHLANIPYVVTDSDAFSCTFWPLKVADDGEVVDDISIIQPTTLRLHPGEDHAEFLKHTFSVPDEGGENWHRPAELVVNRRQDRRVFCVLMADRMQYNVYNMDARTSEEDENDDEMQE